MATTLQDYRDASYEASTKFSNNVRQSSFAGIAIIWIFKTTIEEVNTLPFDLLIPLILIVITLILDSLQYYISSIMWDRYCNKQEDSIDDITKDTEVHPPRHYVKWIQCFFNAKAITIAVAYGFLLWYLIGVLKFI